MAKPEQSLFFLALIPNEVIKAEVTEFKNEVAEKFNSKAALRSPPHITLHMPFKWKSAKEEELVEKLSGFRFDKFPVTVDLDGFDFFEPRVVFVNVLKNEGLTSLQKELNTFVRKHLNIFNSDYKDRGFHPHMTIGFRDLKKSVFQDVKAHYQDQEYSRSFDVSDICLLKHDGKQWQEWRWF